MKATPRRALSPLFVLVCLLAWCAGSPRALAYPDGAPFGGCYGCHAGGRADVQLDLTLEPAVFRPGERVEATLRILAKGAASVGVFISTEGVGTLSARGDSGLSRREDGLAHVAPRALADGRAEFRFRFRAPAEPGVVRFSMYALAANGDGGTRGDTPTKRDVEAAYGCKGTPYYFDADGDGFGRDSMAPTLACAGHAPEHHAPARGDCDDRYELSHPGAEEICDGVDNDCDGEIDEQAKLVSLWPDQDGDGYYEAQNGEPVAGCIGRAGYAFRAGDCHEGDARVHPQQREVCDGQDDDCDGEVDERALPSCGVGACARPALDCSGDSCTPGEPVAEQCNYIDDDCDGQTDEDGDALCAAGEECRRGRCVPLPPVDADDVGEADAGLDTSEADGSDDAGAGAPEGDLEPVPFASEPPQPRDLEGGCNASPGRGRVGWLALALLSLALRRRRVCTVGPRAKPH